MFKSMDESRKWIFFLKVLLETLCPHQRVKHADEVFRLFWQFLFLHELYPFDCFLIWTDPQNNVS